MRPTVNPTISKFLADKKENGSLANSDLVYITYTNPRFTIQASDPRLTPTANQALTDLMTAFFASNPTTNITLTGAFRSFKSQEVVYQREDHGRVATPGSSYHGWGIAIDLFGFGTRNLTLAQDREAAISSFRGEVYQWLHNNAHKYGWYNGHPDGRLRDYNGQDEFWHWEYWGPQASAGSVPAPLSLPDAYNPNKPLPEGTTFLTQGGDKRNTSSNPAEFSLQDLFAEIEANVANSELENVDVEWGKRANNYEDSDWIGFRQYLLYMASKYLPGALFPFIELIPFYYLNGEIPKDNAKVGALTPKDFAAADLFSKDNKTLKDIIGQSNQDLKDLIEQSKQEELKKYAGTYPPGYDDERFRQTSENFNSLVGATDLFNYDPFRQEQDGMYLESESGSSIRARRGVGARIYSQFVLNPAADLTTPSKPGSIGFEDLQIKTGDPTTEGMSLITMTLIDVQGNKFTDVNSPWAFIFEARPGSAGGEFLFRYGWQLRLPKPNDNTISGQSFWNHPGWNLFPGMKDELINRLASSNELLTLTQFSTIDNMFEQDSVFFDEETGRVVSTIFNVEEYAQDKRVNSSYLRLSIIAPELDVDPKTGAMKANLNFYATAALNTLVPLSQAIYIKNLFAKKRRVVTLLDLMEAYDQDVTRYQSPTNRINKKDQINNERGNLILNIRSGRASESNFIKVFGLTSTDDEQTGVGAVKASAVKITLSKEKQALLFNAKGPDTTVTLLNWLSSVLMDNQCELISQGAQRGGVDLNATYLIVCSQPDLVAAKLRDGEPAFDPNYDTVLGYRFQGSLIESLSVARSSQPNAQTIEANHRVAEFTSGDVRSEEQGEPYLSTYQARSQFMIYAFAQLQTLQSTMICHPWIGVSNTVFLKGTGYLDGRYMVLQVIHTLSSDHKFITEIVAARMWTSNSKKKQKKDAMGNAAADGVKEYSKEIPGNKDYYAEKLDPRTLNRIENVS